MKIELQTLKESIIDMAKEIKRTSTSEREKKIKLEIIYMLINKLRDKLVLHNAECEEYINEIIWDELMISLHEIEYKK